MESRICRKCTCTKKFSPFLELCSLLIDVSPSTAGLALSWVSFLPALLPPYISPFSIFRLQRVHHQCTKFLQETLPDSGLYWYCISATCKINIWVCFLSNFATELEEIRNHFNGYRKALGFGPIHELGIPDFEGFILSFLSCLLLVKYGISTQQKR